MEPERKIEKWLRVYAKKRRAQADGDFKLHSATRHLLQDEIARKSSGLKKEEESISLWEFIRRRRAFLLGFAVCVFLLSLILLPILNPLSKKAKPLSLNTTGELGVAAHSRAAEDKEKQVTLGDVINPRRDLKAETPDNNSASSQIAASLPESVATTPPPSVFAGGTSSSALPAPAQPLPPAETHASIAAAVPPEVQSMEPASMPLAKTAHVDQPQPESAASAGTVAYTLSGSSSLGSAASRSVSGTLSTFYKNTAIAQKISLLENFQVQQNGGNLRMVDADGSVYEGALELENGKANSKYENAFEQSDSTPRQPMGGGGGFGGLEGKTVGDSKDSTSAAEYYSFHVSGTNQTLKQNVVFSGYLLRDIVMTKKVSKDFGVTDGLLYGAATMTGQMKPGMTNQPGSLPWADLQIAGSALVNNTNQIIINATPVPAPKN